MLTFLSNIAGTVKEKVDFEYVLIFVLLVEWLDPSPINVVVFVPEPHESPYINW